MESLASGDGLDSLAQSARSKQLKTARNILYVIGVLTVLFNAFMLTRAEQEVDDALEQELLSARNLGMEIDQQELKKLRDSAVRTARLIYGGLIAVGVLYVLFGVFVDRFPVPITIASLVIYIGSIAVFAAINPATIASGIIMKVIIIVCLFKAMQAAIAYEQQQNQELDVAQGGPADDTRPGSAADWDKQYVDDEAT